MARRNRMTLILEAEEFAKNKHQYQFRDNGETLYWTHLQKVVENLIELGIHDENILCAGWLHDTIEDTDTDYDDLDENFNREIADIVSTVTKDTRMIKQKREVDYCAQLKLGSWQAQIVKFADILANMEDLENSKKSDSDRKRQAQNKLEYYNSIKSNLQNNKKKIPNLDSKTTRLFEIFLQYGIKN